MLVLASDHAGFALKECIAAHLASRDIAFEDVGCTDGGSVDYPMIAHRAAMKVASGEAEHGIVVCGTGIGVSIMANRLPGIRCALCGDIYSARMARAHNDSNMLALGGRVLGDGVALDIVEAWLATPFEGGRHQRRIDQLTELSDVPTKTTRK